MTERVLLLLSRPSVLEALQDDDIIETLSEISPISDHYAPTLQFLLRPDNLVALVFTLLEEPPANTGKPPQQESSMEPTYDEYAIVFRAHWVLCSSGFSSQLISALVALQQPTCAVHYQCLCERLVTYYSRDTMNLEAYTRFLNAWMDQYSPDTLVSFFGTTYELKFVQSLLMLVHYEPVRDILLRICNELPAAQSAPLCGLTKQLIGQLTPDRYDYNDVVDNDDVVARVREDPPHVQFSRMIFTCDLVTDLIHERRQGSLGFHLTHDLHHSESHINQLLDAAQRDLDVLPTQLANESHVIKVLNSLLQQAQCGCVSKGTFSAAFMRHPSESSPDEPAIDDAQLSPHVDLPLLWKLFITRLPDLLQFLSIPPQRRYRPSHIQLIYLMLPILNVSCCAVDRHLIKFKTMEGLLDLVIRFPQANILHCAISRLFIVALEDSPFMFGKELPAFRAANDPLRLHLLLKGCFEMVVSVYDEPQQCIPIDNGQNQKESSLPATAATVTAAPSPPPAFVDIAISFDQAVTNAHAQAPHLFSRGVMERWQAFRSRVLLPTQSKWEEQQQDAPVTMGGSPVKRPGGFVDVDGDGDPSEFQEFQEFQDPVSEGRIFLPQTTTTTITKPPPEVLSVPVEAEAEEVPTPLSALYNEEERHLMLRVAATQDQLVSSQHPAVLTTVLS